MASKFLRFAARQSFFGGCRTWAPRRLVLTHPFSSTAEDEPALDELAEDLDEASDPENQVKDNSERKLLLYDQDKLKYQALQDVVLDEDDWKKAVGRFHSLTTMDERVSYINTAMKSSDKKFVIPSLKEGGDIFGVEKKDISRSSSQEIYSFFERYDTNNEYLQLVCQTVAKHLSKLNFKETLSLVECASCIGCSNRSIEAHLEKLLIRELDKVNPINVENTVKSIELARFYLSFSSIEKILLYLYKFESILNLKSSASIFRAVSNTQLASEVALQGFYQSKRLLLNNNIDRHLKALSIPLLDKFKIINMDQNNFELMELIEAVMSLHGKFWCPDTLLPNFIADIFCGPPNRNVHNLSFADSFLEMCVGANYYQARICQTAIDIARSNLIPEKITSLARILRWLAYFDCHSTVLLADVVKILESINFQNSSVLWDIMLHSLCANCYHPFVLKHILSDKFMESNIRKDPFYLKIMIGLTTENHDMANISREAFFHPSYKSNMNEVLKRAYRSCSFFTEEASIEGLSQIMETSFGKHGQPNVVTTGGHVIDYELILGESNEILQFPQFLVQRLYTDGLRSIGVFSGNSHHTEVYKGRVNFASDWMKYIDPDYMMPQIHKKVAFLWPKDTIWFKITARQLQAMGWTVVIIEQEFQNMAETSKVEYIISQLNKT